MEFVPAAAMIALIIKAVDFLRYARAADTNGVFTQLIAWAAGVGVVLLVAQTQWAAGIEIGDRALSTLDIWSQVFAGLTVGSGASLIKDGLKSADNNRSGAIPTLLPHSGPASRHRANSPGDTG